jgi:hypothetical protein
VTHIFGQEATQLVLLSVTEPHLLSKTMAKAMMQHLMKSVICFCDPNLDC